MLVYSSPMLTRKQRDRAIDFLVRSAKLPLSGVKFSLRKLLEAEGVAYTDSEWDMEFTQLIYEVRWSKILKKDLIANS